MFAAPHDRRVAAARHAGDAARRACCRRGGRRGSPRSRRCAPRRRAPAACGSRPARSGRWPALVGRPAQALGGSRGRARAPQRDAPARPHVRHRRGADDRRGAGDGRHRRRHRPEGHGARHAERPDRRRATWSRAPTAGRRPIPAVREAIADAGIGVTAILQDRALAFGEKETVNTHRRRRLPLRLGGGRRRGRARRSAPTAPSSTRAGRRSTASRVGDAFTLTSATGDELDLTVRGIEHSPVIDIMGLGPVTIGPEAYASRVRQRPRVLHVRATPTRRRRWPATRTRRAARPRRSWTSSSR